MIAHKLTACVLTMAVLGGAGAASATEPSSDGTVRTASLAVQERLMTLERIHVTSEKPADPDRDVPAPDLLRLLEEIEQAEHAELEPVSE